MTPNSSDNSGTADSETAAAAAPEIRRDSAEHSAGAEHNTESALPGAPANPALIALLQGFRTADGGQTPPGWAILTDAQRLRAIDDTGLLEPGPHPAVDQVIGMTLEAAGVPYAAINVITDAEQKTIGLGSRVGDVGEPGTRPLNKSLCVYTVMSGGSLIIDDISDDPVLVNHPAARAGEVAAYIGIPIVDDAGRTVATLCAWDTQPHHWSGGEIQIMTDLADVVRHIIFDN